MLLIIMGRPAPLVVEGDSWIQVEVSILQIGQKDIPKLTLSANGPSTCLMLTAPFSLQSTDHLVLMVVLHATMTISSSLMVWRVIVHHWGDSVKRGFLLQLPHQLELLALSLREELIQIVHQVAEEYALNTLYWFKFRKARHCISSSCFFLLLNFTFHLHV